MADEYYEGWLYADPKDRDSLQALGVFGPMVYEDQKTDVIKNSKRGVISHCVCTKETLMLLVDHYNQWWKNNYIHYKEREGKMLDYPIEHFSKTPVIG